jgi:hypothetical protein
MQKCSLLSRYARNHPSKKANGKIAPFFAEGLISALLPNGEPAIQRAAGASLSACASPASGLAATQPIKI